MNQHEQDVKPTKATKRSKATTRTNVTFHLPTHEYRALQHDAEIRGLDSLHQRGREIVIDYLNGQSAEEVAERISRLDQEVVGVKEVVLHLEMLIRRLAYITIAVSQEHDSQDIKQKQSDAANEWVKQNMPRKEDRS